ncbi:transcriptional regulator [Rhizobium sp. BK251]|uniref:winged helix-turn-helix domain-containing protein n=1 Tax=Rhizobium sp. BK251 TaxID=2512125 RepID=UPI0010440719|nr:transcriptional regulator [Rhizobium sp. BK251]TCL71063.1 transcriptional regulator [Rhizobium sp. BK251]
MHWTGTTTEIAYNLNAFLCATNFKHGLMDDPPEAYVFDDFVLLPQQQRVKKDGKVLPIGGRAFLILQELVKRAGELVSKEELIEAAWPDTFVEDGNLNVQICALRKHLATDASRTPYIVNIPGRGYRFTGCVRHGFEATVM